MIREGHLFLSRRQVVEHLGAEPVSGVCGVLRVQSEVRRLRLEDHGLCVSQQHPHLLSV